MSFPRLLSIALHWNYFNVFHYTSSVTFTLTSDQFFQLHLMKIKLFFFFTLTEIKQRRKKNFSSKMNEFFIVLIIFH